MRSRKEYGYTSTPPLGLRGMFLVEQVLGLRFKHFGILGNEHSKLAYIVPRDGNASFFRNKRESLNLGIKMLQCMNVYSRLLPIAYQTYTYVATLCDRVEADAA